MDTAISNKGACDYSGNDYCYKFWRLGTGRSLDSQSSSIKYPITVCCLSSCYAYEQQEANGRVCKSNVAKSRDDHNRMYYRFVESLADYKRYFLIRALENFLFRGKVRFFDKLLKNIHVNIS